MRTPCIVTDTRDNMIWRYLTMVKEEEAISTAEE
jgi:hypothetical protein